MNTDFAYNNITGHQPKTRELPELDFDLAGIDSIIKHCRAHVPNAQPQARQFGEAIDSSGLEVVIVR